LSNVHHTIAASRDRFVVIVWGRSRAGRGKALAPPLQISRGMTRRLLLAAVPVLFMACEHGIDMEGTVVVPAEVQELFSADEPGQLFVVASLPQAPSELQDDRTMFCMPAGGERRISVQAFGFGCAEANDTQVSAFAVPRTTEQVDCSGEGSLRPQKKVSARPSFDRFAALATGTVAATVQVDGGGGCSDGHIRFTLTLAPASQTAGR
jgi:hypothetical protein